MMFGLVRLAVVLLVALILLALLVGAAVGVYFLVRSSKKNEPVE